MDWSELVYYDETSPSCLRWKVKRPKNKVNGVVGHKHPRDYFYVIINRKCYPVHRIVYELLISEIREGHVIDHIDKNSYNNKISNLREVTRLVNLRNQKMNNKNKSGHTGVNYDEKSPGRFYWTATWRAADESGKLKQRSKGFSIKKYGNDTAYQMACEYRAKMIDLLNTKGAGYTQDHGKQMSPKTTHPQVLHQTIGHI